MARPQKAGIDYFPVDVTFFTDSRIESLVSLHGASAPSVYLYLVCKAYSEYGYYLPITRSTLAVCAKNLNMSQDAVKAIFSDCMNFGLFDVRSMREHEIVTSAEIQSNYQEACKARGKRRLVSVRSDYWLLSQASTCSWVLICDVNTDEKTQGLLHKVDELRKAINKSNLKVTGNESNINYDAVSKYLEMDFEKYSDEL